jgi:hypothetical protein
MEKSEDDGGDQVHAATYVVAFIDLLGQGEELKRRFLPTDNGEALKYMKQSIGKIFATQNNFQKYYDAFSETGKSSLYELLPVEGKLALSDMAPGELKWQRFSDGFVVYFPLAQELNPSPLNSIFGLLVAVGMLALTGLAGKSPIRVGIDAAWAVEYRPNELYGAAIAFAYDLESKVAAYPRAVVGEGLLAYLRTTSITLDNTLGGTYRRAMSTECQNLLRCDDDNQTVVNYLSPFFMKQYNSNFSVRKTVELAREFANEQHQHWSQANCNKLTDRYARLLRFMDANTVGD